MGLGKADGEHIVEMTEPDGWPKIDEDLLFERASVHLALRDSVHAALTNWRDQHARLIDGSVWSGDGSRAGGAAIQRQIREMEDVETHLAKAYSFYQMAGQRVADAKMEINANLTLAQAEIQEIKNSKASAAAKELRLIEFLSSENEKNSAEVMEKAASITPFAKFQPPSNSIPSPSALPVTTHGNERLVEKVAWAAAPPKLSSPSSVLPQSVGVEKTTMSPMQPTPTPRVAAQNPDISAPGRGIPPTQTGLNSTSASSGTNLSPTMQSGIGSSTTGSTPLSSETTASSSGTNSSGATAGSLPSGKAAASTTDTSQRVTQAVSNRPIAPPTPLQQSSAQPVTLSSAPTNQSAAIPSTGGSSPATTGGASGAAPSGAAPVGAAPVGGSTAAPPPVPLGPPTTPAPPAPPAAGTAPAAAGPGVAPMSAASASGAAAAPAPVPVSTARAERDAILAASTPGGRKAGGGDPLQRARHIGAALNVGVMDFGFFWVTGLTADGTIVVANSYGLAYIPDGVHLPEHVKMATADESISPAERATWATYPILAIQGWCRHHDKQLRAVVATEEQFANFDPGVARIVLTTEDIPDDGTMNGRNRLEVIAPDAAQRLNAVADTGLTELLPPAATDLEPPADQSAKLWFNVAKPLMSTSPQRGAAHLHAFVAYANHAQELTLHRAQTASEPDAQRHAITDWIYWQHLGVLMNDAVASEAPA